VEGPLKVTGRAMYSSDHHFPGTLYAVPVCSTIAHGEIESIDSAAAEKSARESLRHDNVYMARNYSRSSLSADSYGTVNPLKT